MFYRRWYRSMWPWSSHTVPWNGGAFSRRTNALVSTVSSRSSPCRSSRSISSHQTTRTRWTYGLSQPIHYRRWWSWVCCLCGAMSANAVHWSGPLLCSRCRHCQTLWSWGYHFSRECMVPIRVLWWFKLLFFSALFGTSIRHFINLSSAFSIQKFLLKYLFLGGSWSWSWSCSITSKS